MNILKKDGKGNDLAILFSIKLIILTKYYKKRGVSFGGLRSFH